MNQPSTIKNIQVLRGIAAMMVVTYHAIGLLESRSGRTLDFHHGVLSSGVDLFFVISGFIMVFVVHTRHQAPLDFLYNRLCRIAPLYWFYTLLILIIALTFPSLLKGTEIDFTHVVQSFLFIPAYHPAQKDMLWPLLIPGWTLNFEMFFYIIFGALLAVKSSGLRIVFLTIALTSLVFYGLVTEPTGPRWEAYTSPLLLEFLAGALVGDAYVRGQRITRYGAWICITLGLCLFAVDAGGVIWTEARAARWGLPSVLVFIGALGLESSRPTNKVLKQLGDASYSIYLSQVFTIGFFGFIWLRIGNGSLLFDTAIFLLAIFTSAVIGIISHQLIERPINELIKNKQRRSHNAVTPILNKSD